MHGKGTTATRFKSVARETDRREGVFDLSIDFRQASLNQSLTDDRSAPGKRHLSSAVSDAPAWIVRRRRRVHRQPTLFRSEYECMCVPHGRPGAP